MSDQPWTIESIRDALGNPALVQDFLSEINRAPADQLLDVFAHWQTVAATTLDAAERARVDAAAEARGERPAAGWADVTDRVLADAARNRQRGAA